MHWCFPLNNEIKHLRALRSRVTTTWYIIRSLRIGSRQGREKTISIVRYAQHNIINASPLCSPMRHIDIIVPSIQRPHSPSITELRMLLQARHRQKYIPSKRKRSLQVQNMALVVEIDRQRTIPVPDAFQANNAGLNPKSLSGHIHQGLYQLLPDIMKSKLRGKNHALGPPTRLYSFSQAVEPMLPGCCSLKYVIDIVQVPLNEFGKVRTSTEDYGFPFGGPCV